MHSGVRREISGLNEDRFVYVKALLIGRTVRVQTVGSAIYEGLFHSCSQDQDSSIILQDAQELRNGQKGEVIPTLIIAGKEVESLQAYRVPTECELFGAPGSERLYIREPVPIQALEPLEDAVVAEYEDSITAVDPNLIPQKQREEAERLAWEMEAERHPTSGGPAEVAELPRLGEGMSSSSRPGRFDLLRVKTARKDGLGREANSVKGFQPMVGRGLNAMNLELPMSPTGVRFSGENQVTQQALHQLKELQNVQGPAATREVLLRQHFRLEGGQAQSEDGAKHRSVKGLLPLGLLVSVPKGREEPIMAGPVAPGVVAAGSNDAQRGWDNNNSTMLALTKSINSLNLEPGPAKAVLQRSPTELEGQMCGDDEPVTAERSDTPESQMMPIFQPKVPEEEMEMLQEQQQQLQQQMQQQQLLQQQLQQQRQQLLQMQQLSPQQLQQLQMQMQMQQRTDGQQGDGHAPPSNAPVHEVPNQLERRKQAGGEGKGKDAPSTPSSSLPPGQPLQPGQQPSRPEEGKQRRPSKDLGLPLSLSEELPRPLAIGRQKGGKSSANERNLHRTNTPSNDAEGEPAGLPLQMRVDSIRSMDLPVDQEQGPLEPGLMKREDEKMPHFQCIPSGSPLTTGMVFARFFDQASKETAVNSPVQWPQAIGGSYKNILTEQLQASSPIQSGMAKVPIDQFPLQEVPPQAPMVQAQQMQMRHQNVPSQPMVRPSPMLPGPMSNENAMNWQQSPSTPGGQTMTRLPSNQGNQGNQGLSGDADTQGQKGGKRERRGRKKERTRPENAAAGGVGPGCGGCSAGCGAGCGGCSSSCGSACGGCSSSCGSACGGCGCGCAAAAATAPAPGGCSGCGCGMTPCQPCGCAMMGGCCGGCCVLGCGGGDGSCGMGSSAQGRSLDQNLNTNPSNSCGGCGCGCGGCGQMGGCGCSPGQCGCGGCGMGQMGNAAGMSCGGCGACQNACCAAPCGSCGGGCPQSCGPGGCGCGGCCGSSCTGACGCNSASCGLGSGCGSCGACSNSCGCQGCGGNCMGCGCGGCGCGGCGCNPCGCMPCGGAGCLPCGTAGCIPCGGTANCAAGGPNAGCGGGTPCNSLDSNNFRGNGCGGCQAAMCGGTPCAGAPCAGAPCGCGNLPSGCCSSGAPQGGPASNAAPAGAVQAENSGGNCGGCNFNSQQLPLVGLLPIQQGMPLGMPMALISTGGGQGGCFPAAYLMAQDSMQQQQPPTPSQMNQQITQMPQQMSQNHQ